MNSLPNIHPLVVHFPIAFLYLFLCIGIINVFLKNRTLEKYSIILMSLGIIGGMIAVLSGNLEYQALVKNEFITQVHLQSIEQHELYATITIWFFTAFLIFQYYIYIKKINEHRYQILFVIFVLTAAYLLYVTSKIGGKLVYEYGIGTDLLK